MTSKLFSELGLSPALLKAIDRLGYEKAAPIQSEAIPSSRTLFSNKGSISLTLAEPCR
jgi:hypothetical protein